MSFFLSKEKERENCLMSMVTSRVEAMFLFSSASYLQGSIRKKTFFRLMNRRCISISCCVREVFPVLKKVVLTFLKAIWREAFLCVFVCVFHCIATSWEKTFFESNFE